MSSSWPPASSGTPADSSATSSGYVFPKSYSAVQYQSFHRFLNNPGSLFEHKIFTTLSVLMRNLTEQIQDYTVQYYSVPPDQFYNASVRLLEEEDVREAAKSSRTTSSTRNLYSGEYTNDSNVFIREWEGVGRGVVTFLCVLTGLYFLNRSLFRRNRLIQYGIEVVACHAIVLPFLPFVAAFFAAIGIVRVLLWVHIKLFHNGKRFMVSPEDGFWAYEQHGSSSASIGLYMIEGVCDIAKITEQVKFTVASQVVNGRMNRRLITVCGFAVWEYVDVDVKNHVRIATEDKKKTCHRRGPWSDKDVLDYLSSFQDEPINCERPPWEVIIVPDVRIKGRADTSQYSCIFRVHHGLMDGISSANILHQALGDKPFKFTIDPVEGGKRRGKLITFLTYFLGLLVLPRTGIVNGLLGLDNRHNRWFSPGKVLQGPKHFSWSRPLKMEALKRIKDASKSSVMTVLLSSLGGSYRSMEVERSWRVQGGKGKRGSKGKVNALPEWYHALAPVAMLPYPDRHPRNGFSGVVLPVCVGEHATAAQRLRVNDSAFRNLGIGVLDIIGMLYLIGMVGVMPNCLQYLFGRAVHFKMSLSNIPGSEEEIFIFGGDRIVEMGAWLPCKFTLGMAMGLFSYGGRCRATMVGDTSYLSKSDVESLVANFETELIALGESLGIPEHEIFCC